MNVRKEYLKITAPNISGSTFKHNAKKISKSPYFQFGILFAIVMAIMILDQLDLIYAQTSVAYLMCYAIAAIGFCLLLGYSGLASLGTAGFIGVGTYMCHYTIKMWGITFLPGLLITGIIAIAIGCIIGFISLRIEGIYLAITTLAISEVIILILRAIEAAKIDIKFDQMFMFLQLDYFNSEIAVYTIVAVILAMLLIFTANLINSPTGRAMQAMKSSTSAAQAMGISLMKYRLLAFVIATLFATVSGYLYMMITKNIVPTSETKFNLATSLNILGAVIIGGSMSIWGVLGGIFFVFGLQPLVLSNIPFFQQNEEFIVLLTGLLMIIVVMFFPGGFAHIVLQIRFSINKALQKWRVRKYGTEA